MLALVIFGILIAYLALAVIAVRATVRSARASGLSAKQRWLRGGLVALVFYLIPFWDWIPTVVAHQYYCATEAKFEVFKTIEQWKIENKSDLDRLRHDPRAKVTEVDGYERYPLNQRLVSDRIFKTPVFLTVSKRQGRIVDLKDQSQLARWVDFSSGYTPLSVGGAGAWKFWLHRDVCDRTSDGYWSNFTRLEQQVQQLGVGSK